MNNITHCRTVAVQLHLNDTTLSTLSHYNILCKVLILQDFMASQILIIHTLAPCIVISVGHTNHNARCGLGTKQVCIHNAHRFYH